MATAPLDSCEVALNVARVRVNDAIQSLAGDIMTDVNPFTLIYLNNAWRRLQELLVNFGYPWFKPESILHGAAPVFNTDPSAQVNISWAGYSDGFASFLTPALPQNLIQPLILWERVTGSGSAFFPMDKLDNGLPAVTKTQLNRSWEWRNGAIYMPGALSTTDIRLRYAAFYPDFVSPNGLGGVSFANQPIPIVRAMNALAWFICAEFAKTRGDVDAGDFDAKGQMAAKFIFDLDPMQARSVANEAEYGKMVDKFSATMGPTGPRGMQGGE